jgi:hypothetical protein
MAPSLSPFGPGSTFGSLGFLAVVTLASLGFGLFSPLLSAAHFSFSLCNGLLSLNCRDTLFSNGQGVLATDNTKRPLDVGQCLHGACQCQGVDCLHCCIVKLDLQQMPNLLSNRLTQHCNNRYLIVVGKFKSSVSALKYTRFAAPDTVCAISLAACKSSAPKRGK